MLASVLSTITMELDAPRRFARTGGALGLDVHQQVQRVVGAAMGIWMAGAS